MKILAIGDIVGSRSVDYLSDRLFRVKRELGIDFVIGEGNGNPLQYSCLENPMDGGAW